MKKEILLLGAGGHCHSVIDVIEQEGIFSIAGIVDNEKRSGEMILGYPIVGCDDDLVELRKKYQYAFISVGQIKSSAIRVKLFKLLKKLEFKIPVIISPLAYVSKYTSLEEGTIVMHHALINANAKVGKNCIINTKSLIEHDCLVEEFCHISTGAILNGGVNVQSNSFVGSNATSVEYTTISGFIKAGSVKS
jgi:sugar O-acyltransferase (sialic acid O-acetyltransferase NeuD family)